MKAILTLLALSISISALAESPRSADPEYFKAKDKAVAQAIQDARLEKIRRLQVLYFEELQKDGKTEDDLKSSEDGTVYMKRAQARYKLETSVKK